MTVTIFLTGSGSNTGPIFNIRSDDDDYATVLDTATRNELIAGYTTALIPDGANTIMIESTGDCTNYRYVTIIPYTTTTSTSSTTTTTTTVASRDIELTWTQTDCTVSGAADSPSKTAKWDLSLDTPLIGSETIYVTLSYSLDNQSTNSTQQRSYITVYKDGTTLVEQQSSITTYLNEKTGDILFTISAGDQDFSVELYAAVDGDGTTAGYVTSEIASSVMGSFNVNVTEPLTDPSITVLPNGSTEACSTTTTSTTAAPTTTTTSSSTTTTTTTVAPTTTTTSTSSTTTTTTTVAPTTTTTTTT